MKKMTMMLFALVLISGSLYAQCTGPGCASQGPSPLDACMKLNDGKARGLCLTKVPVYQRVGACNGIGSALQVYPNNCVQANKIAANRAYKQNHIECCVPWSAANSPERKACCKDMKTLGCSHYWKLPNGQCKNATNACEAWPQNTSVTTQNCQG